MVEYIDATTWPDRPPLASPERLFLYQQQIIENGYHLCFTGIMKNHFHYAKDKTKTTITLYIDSEKSLVEFGNTKSSCIFLADTHEQLSEKIKNIENLHI